MQEPGVSWIDFNNTINRTVQFVEQLRYFSTQHVFAGTLSLRVY
jgi:hypothetical protein